MRFLLDVVHWFASGSHWQGVDGVPHRLLEHVAMSFAATASAASLALPTGVGLGHFGRGGNMAINISNLGRAVPSFAVLVIALQLVGLGAPPAFLALTLLAIPPMVTNSYVGMRQVDADVREAARGMGMTERQLLVRVELPLALPVIMAGVRTAAVQVVATATLAALVAWGGLGRYIIDGISQRDFTQVFAGAILVALLAILTELCLAGLQRLTMPAGMKVRESPDKGVFSAEAASRPGTA